MAEKCSAEADGFPPQFYLLKHDIDQFQEQMTLSQSQRQNDIWTLLERAVKWFNPVIIAHIFYCLH